MFEGVRKRVEASRNSPPDGHFAFQRPRCTVPRKGARPSGMEPAIRRSHHPSAMRPSPSLCRTRRWRVTMIKYERLNKRELWLNGLSTSQATPLFPFPSLSVIRSTLVPLLWYHRLPLPFLLYRPQRVVTLTCLICFHPTRQLGHIEYIAAWSPVYSCLLRHHASYTPTIINSAPPTTSP